MLLSAVVAAVGAADRGLHRHHGGQGHPERQHVGIVGGVVGGIVALVILFSAYYCGGYVAGWPASKVCAKAWRSGWGEVRRPQLAEQLPAHPHQAGHADRRRDHHPHRPPGGVSLIGALLGGLGGIRYHRTIDHTGLGD